jgi:hypothetical protein
LWLVQSVDTAQAHIYHICNVSNLYKIKFLENLLAGFRGSGISGVGAGNSGVPGYSGPGPETPGFKGINNFDRGEKVSFHHFSVLAAPSLFPPSPHSLPLGDFHSPRTKSHESEGLKAPRCGDQGSTQDSKDSSLLPSLPRMVRVKVSRGNEEPSTQRRTKARHDPAALRAVREALGQEGSQRSSSPRRGDPPPSYAEGSEDEIEEEEEERTESDGDEEDETYEQSPEPPRRHGKGSAKEKTPLQAPSQKEPSSPICTSKPSSYSCSS